MSAKVLVFLSALVVGQKKIEIMILDKENLPALTAYLQSKSFIAEDEAVLSAEKPGEGNMNYTLRIVTDRQSMIAKQANPFVQKYPQIAAPPQRALVEANFYLTVQHEKEIYSMMPGLIGVDEQNFIIILQDLGLGKDCSYLYASGEKISEGSFKKLCLYLSKLHGAYKADGELTELQTNRALRALNHEHLFIYPFLEENGLDLDAVQPGLKSLSAPFLNDIIRKKAKDLGEKYLSDGSTLLHGDFYPGSWMLVNEDIKVLDPEFAFYGDAAFDVGVMVAHLHLARQDKSLIENIFTYYKASPDFNHDLCRSYTGIEIIRRILGLAQLPLSLSIAEKKSCLDMAMEMMG